jgi:hypothetical protein
VHQVRGWFSGDVAELAILEGASEAPYVIESDRHAHHEALDPCELMVGS